MKIVVRKIYIGGQIVYRSLVPPIKTASLLDILYIYIIHISHKKLVKNIWVKISGLR